MQVIFETSDPQAAKLRTVTERRVRKALRRLAWLTPRVRVHLSDVNGTRGGIDKHCQIELMTDGGSPIVVTSLARDWFSAMQSALSRAIQSLICNLQRMHKTRTTGRDSLRIALVI